MWDFWSLSPESLHQVTILMSDRGLPMAPMYMNGYGSHTYSMINAAGERPWVKFHFKTMQGHHHYTNAEAGQIVGKSRETYQEELFGTIARAHRRSGRCSSRSWPNSMRTRRATIPST